MQDFSDRKDKQFMSDNEMKAMCTKGMDSNQKGMFDQKMGELKQGRDSDEQKWDTKMNSMRGESGYAQKPLTNRMGKV